MTILISRNLLSATLTALVASVLVATATPVLGQLPSALPPPQGDIEYTVRSGDTMIGLALRYLIEGRQLDVQRALQRHNNQRDADRISPGQIVRIPVNWIRSTAEAAEITQAQGEVQAAGLAVEQGANLRAGATLQTGASSYATLKLSDGSTLALQPNSSLEVVRVNKTPLSPATDASFLLNSGRVRADVEKRSPTGPRFEVRTPLAVAAVRGTQFRVNIDPARPGVTTEVLEGAVSAADSGNRGSVNVEGGFGTRVPEGAAPLEPRRLLRAPTIWNGPRLMNRRPSAFPFPSLQGAVAYRIQVLRGALVVSENVVQSPDIRIEDLENGNYVIRVRGIDDIGLEGMDWSGDLWVRVSN